jgi:hypothetical protein
MCTNADARAAGSLVSKEDQICGYRQKKETDHSNESKRKKKEWNKLKRKERERGWVKKVGRPFSILLKVERVDQFSSA